MDGDTVEYLLEFLISLSNWVFVQVFVCMLVFWTNSFLYLALTLDVNVCKLLNICQDIVSRTFFLKNIFPYYYNFCLPIFGELCLYWELILAATPVLLAKPEEWELELDVEASILFSMIIQRGELRRDCICTIICRSVVSFQNEERFIGEHGETYVGISCVS